MRAVLADALACFQHGLVNSKQRVQRVAQEAEAWFLNDDDHWPFSFVSICAVLAGTGVYPAGSSGIGAREASNQCEGNCPASG